MRSKHDDERERNYISFENSSGTNPKNKIISSGIQKEIRQIHRARVLDDRQVERVLAHINATSNSRASDEVKFLLSVYAGLRACEIAAMTLECVVDADGRIGRTIFISRHAAKGGRERTIPMHPQIREALVRFRKMHPEIRILSFSARRGYVRPQKASAITAWFRRLYEQVGLQGCSSHSGRRTFITRMARMANLHGNSLRDVQLLAGHAQLETTAAYIDSTHALYGLVAALGRPGTSSPSTTNEAGA